MKLLIDTQVFIWLVNEDGRLGRKTANLLKDKSNELGISYFSVFEMTIKAAIGKLDFDPSVIDDLPKIGIDLLLPEAKTLDKYKIYDKTNKDPFDNALIAVALKVGCAFVTSDTNILRATVNGLKLIDARQ